jgi:hypothetical protein
VDGFDDCVAPFSKSVGLPYPDLTAKFLQNLKFRPPAKKLPPHVLALAIDARPFYSLRCAPADRRHTFLCSMSHQSQQFLMRTLPLAESVAETVRCRDSSAASARVNRPLSVWPPLFYCPPRLQSCSACFCLHLFVLQYSCLS